MTAIAGFNGAVYITSSPSVSFTNTAMTDSGDHITYTMSVSSKRYWDNTASFTVQVSANGTSGWVNASGYTITHVGGIIVFSVAQTATPYVQVSGYYFPYSQIGDGHEWEVQLDTTIVDVSTFGSPWKKQFSTVNSASGKFAKYYNDASYLGYLGTLMIFILYANTTTGTRYEGYGYLKQDSIKNDEKSVIMEDVSFEITGPLYCIS